MELKLVILLYTGTLILSQTGAETAFNYKVINNKKTWPDADADCRSRDGTLLVLDTHEKVVNFQHNVVMETDHVVWTAAYRQYSPWVWVEGCFRASFFTKKDGVRLSMNTAAECATLCRGSAYAALKGYMCFCLEDMRDLLPMNARECNTPCPGSAGEMCGGQRDTVSLYSLGGVNGYKESDKEIAKQLQQSIHDVSRSDWKNCVYILKHATPVWVTADCRKSLPFLCKIYRENGTIVEYKSPRKQFGSWMESRDMCREEGGTLADLHANSMEAVNALPENSEYWVGLYRNTSWTWQTDDLEEMPSWCTSFSEDKAGELHFKTEPCSIPNEYICQIPQKVAAANNSKMVIFLVCGSVAWVLALATGVLVFYLMRKRGYCRRKPSDIPTGRTGTSYLDLDEDQNASRTPWPHSYVNSDVSQQPSCSQPPPLPGSNKKPTSSKGKDQSARFQASAGNEYATVCMSKFEKRDPAQQYDDLSQAGACGSNRGWTSSEGEYDVVWDSVMLGKHLNTLSRRVKQTSCSSENIYSDIEKVTKVDLPEKTGNDYTTTHSSLFPPSNEFGLEMVRGKPSLSRTRSDSI